MVLHIKTPKLSQFRSVNLVDSADVIVLVGPGSALVRAFFNWALERSFTCMSSNVAFQGGTMLADFVAEFANELSVVATTR